MRSTERHKLQRSVGLQCAKDRHKTICETRFKTTRDANDFSIRNVGNQFAGEQLENSSINGTFSGDAVGSCKQFNLQILIERDLKRPWTTLAFSAYDFFFLLCHAASRNIEELRQPPGGRGGYIFLPSNLGEGDTFGERKPLRLSLSRGTKY